MKEMCLVAATACVAVLACDPIKRIEQAEMIRIEQRNHEACQFIEDQIAMAKQAANYAKTTR